MGALFTLVLAFALVVWHEDSKKKRRAAGKRVRRDLSLGWLIVLLIILMVLGWLFTGSS